MDAAKRGAAALDAGNFDDAIKEYTAALRELPKAVDFYLKRSSAYQRATNYEAAIKDAELAVHFAFERAKRELIGQAQLRRATILFNMGQYANAQYVLDLVKKYDKDNKTIPIWEMKIASKLKAAPENNDSWQVTAVEHPRVEIPSEESKVKAVASTAPAATTVAKPLQQTPSNLIKHEWYQNNESVFFSLLAKGIPREKAVVEIEEHSINISFPTIAGTDYEFSLDPLFSAINPTQSTYKITPHKVELVLRKVEAGRKWQALESPDGPAKAAVADSDETNLAFRQAVLAADKAPVYPTSSKSGPKDWDKVVSDITKKPKEEDDGGVDDMDDLDYGGDEANLFFKKLYANAPDDTKRAMMKSYQESNGTVLSTDWGSVSKGKVETSPPDGMEAKKWGE